MEWLNIRLTQLSAPEYLRSDPTERATWLQLLAHCAGQENGGVIRDCGDWKCRVWQQICGITHREAHTQSRLWTWHEADLHVWGYPLEKEQIVKQKRAIAAAGGRQSGKARAAAKPEANGEAYASPNAEPTPNASLQRKGKEGKGKEEELLQQQPTREAAVSPPLDRGISLEKAREFANLHNRSSTDGIHIPMPVVTAWHDDRTATGWTTVRDGTEFPIRDWQADLRRYARKWDQNERSPKPITSSSTPRQAPTLSTPKKNGW